MVLLLALPAVSSDYALGIYGNANEDGTINVQDVTLIDGLKHASRYRGMDRGADGRREGRFPGRIDRCDDDGICCRLEGEGQEDYECLIDQEEME